MALDLWVSCPLIVCVKVLGPLTEIETEVPLISQSQRMNCLSPQLVCLFVEKNLELPELEEELKKKSQLKKQRKKINRVLDLMATLREEQEGA